MADNTGISGNTIAVLDKAEQIAAGAGAAAPQVEHWLVAVLGSYLPIAAKVAGGADLAAVLADAQSKVAGGAGGTVLDRDSVAAKMRERAAARGAGLAVIKDLAAVVLEAAGIAVQAEDANEAVAAVPTAVGPGTQSVSSTSTPPIGQPPEAGQPPAGQPQVSPPPIAGDVTAAPPRADLQPTPTIDRFGRDLTAEARAGKSPQLYGREKEVQTIIEVLCRSEKRNPLLIGPPGCGKTAIVEGLAMRVARGEVPDFLKGVRVLSVETSTLLSGTGIVGSFEERITQVLKEASQPGVVLFLDEAHTMVEAGGRGSGFADILKPALARGQMALIAATTDDEYRRIIKPSGAFERRFTTVSITEMSPLDTLEVLKIRRERLKQTRGVDVPDEILADLVDFAEDNMRRRTFPDKAIDLLEQCVAHAVAENNTCVTNEDATAVTSRLIGSLVPPHDALSALSAELERLGMGKSESAKRLLSRLTTTLNGLDYRSWRPNLVLALAGEAARQTGLAARTLALALYGSDDRVITIDLSNMRDDESLTALIGPPPGYIGYGRALPIHELGLTPQAVVVVAGADRCHASVADVIAQGLAQGHIADTMGDRYYFSDAVVLVSVPASGGRGTQVGFQTTTEQPDPAKEWTCDDLVDYVGKSMAAQVDLVLSDFASGMAGGNQAWIRATLLPGVAERYGRKGIQISWDDAVVDYFVTQTSSLSDTRDIESFTEERISRAVLEGVVAPRLGETRRVRLLMSDGSVVAQQQNGETPAS